MRLDGDEALRRICLVAKADVQSLYDERGRILPIHQWPPEAALAVKAIKDG